MKTDMTDDQTRPESRWMILAEDGRHSWIGRHSDPTPSELAAAGSALDGMKLSGWLVVCRGDYWMGGEPELMVVRRVTLRHPTEGDEASAVERWRAARREKLSSISGES